MIWRLVIEKVATLEELEKVWTIDDMADAHDVLDYREDINAASMKKINPPKGLRKR